MKKNLPMVISQEHKDFYVKVAATEFCGVEVSNSTKDEGKVRVWAAMKSGSTPLGGTYSSRLKADKVADAFLDYISNPYPKEDFQFPSDWEVIE